MDYLSEKTREALTITTKKDESDEAAPKCTVHIDSYREATHEKTKSIEGSTEVSPSGSDLTLNEIDLCSESGPSPASSGSRSPSSTVLLDSEHDPSDEEDPKDTAVVESNARLIPACWEYHPLFSKGKGKGKARADSPPTSAKQTYHCGDWEICYQHVILPLPAAEGASYRLVTSHPEEDLKRWLLTPNDALDGTNGQRTLDFVLSDPRYDRHMLLSALKLAIEQIRAEMTHIDSLLSYAARLPYDLSFCWNDDFSSIFDRETDLKCILPEADRESLGEELFRATEDLDFLKERASWVCEGILRCKVEAAKGGNGAEVEWLVGMGVVDEGWVGENCCV